MKPQKQPSLEVVGLEARELLSTMMAESEPNNAKAAADVIRFDPADGIANVSGAISGRKDRDFMRFSADAATTVTLNCAGSQSFACKVSVEDSRGMNLLETESNNGRAAGTFSVQAGQEIFIRVREQRHRGGDYDIQLSLMGRNENNPMTPVDVVPTADAPPANDSMKTEPSRDTPPPNITVESDPARDPEPSNNLSETEPNDSKSLANPFDLGSDGVIRLEGSAVEDGDQDYFVFTPATSGTLNVAVQANRVTSAKLEIETASGAKVFETDPNDGLNSGSLQVTAGVTYFIRLSSPIHPSAPYVVDLALR